MKMPKVARKASAKEILMILNNQWLSTKDIQIVAGVGEGKARKIKSNISEEQNKKNIFTPTNLISSESLVKYLNLNVSYLQRIARSEMYEKENLKIS